MSSDTVKQVCVQMHTQTHTLKRACSSIIPLSFRDKGLVTLWWGPVTNPYSVRGCRQRHTHTHTHAVDTCEREIWHTHSLDLWMHAYTHWLSLTLEHRHWCCVAGWLGVKAMQSYWRQVGERRWLTKPNHTGECCLGHLTIRSRTVCVRMLAYLDVFLHLSLNVSVWTLDEGSHNWGLSPWMGQEERCQG